MKVLDFGLAKSIEQTELTPDSPTILSTAGMILGTAGYMSPEQARGQQVDKRADIWAFGVVFYEMLTSRRLFEGKTVSDALAAVLMLEPEFERTPAKVQRLLRACLQKDLKNRLHDIADWKLLLEESAPTAVAPARSRLAKSTPWVIAAALFLAAAGLGGVAYLRSSEPQPGVLKLSVLPPGNVSSQVPSQVSRPFPRMVDASRFQPPRKENMLFGCAISIPSLRGRYREPMAEGYRSGRPTAARSAFLKATNC